ncbi:MAG: peptidoglycan editing factor PgeF [Clostridia bacterium]|nr:peptidoglycan editing factor PgeF [Clostridia bacterium]
MFTLKTHGDLKYFTIDEFSETGLLKHCFTTRCGGVSENEFRSLNLRMHSEDKKENILKNYEIICDEIGVDFKNLVFSNQVHCDTILSVKKEDMGNGITKPQKWDGVDGLITNEPGVPIIIFAADCVPVFFFDKKKKVIALVHSGWKGTVLKISAKCIEKMVCEYACDPADIMVAIGPSIGVCHFEVGDDVADIFRDTFGDSVLEKHEKWHVNMQKAIEIQVREMGVEKIINADICTYCQSDLLFSHRKTGGKRGVMAGIMELK